MNSENHCQEAFELKNLVQESKSENSLTRNLNPKKSGFKNSDEQGVSRDFVNQNSQNKAKNEPFYFLNIFKPCGITSFDVIYKLRKRLKIKKIGHSGTLDPLAEGVMQVGVGKATRLLDFLGSDKKYVAKIRFGYLSSTCDAEGDITFFNIPKFTREELLASLKSLTGQIEQIPPAYSAVKVGGKKLCDLARQKAKKAKGGKNESFDNIQKQYETLTVSDLQVSETCSNPYIALNDVVQKNENHIKSDILDVSSDLLQVDSKNEHNSLLRNINENLLDFEVSKRIVTIYEAKLLSFVTPMETQKENSKNLSEKIQEKLKENICEAEIEITCSKGTYIRSFAVDLAQKLGTGAYLTGLKRVKAGNFDIKDSVQIDNANPEINAINPCAALDLPGYELNEEEYKKVLNGVSFPAREKLEKKKGCEERQDVKKLHNDASLSKLPSEQYFMLIFQNNLVSIAVLSDNNFVCKKVFK